MAKKQRKIDEKDFAALERLARGITPEKLRPLSGAMRSRWNAAKGFHAKRRHIALQRLRAFREEMAKKGLRITAKDIRAAVRESRR